MDMLWQGRKLKNMTVTEEHEAEEDALLRPNEIVVSDPTNGCLHQGWWTIANQDPILPPHMGNLETAVWPSEQGSRWKDEPYPKKKKIT